MLDTAQAFQEFGLKATTNSREGLSVHAGVLILYFHPLRVPPSVPVEASYCIIIPFVVICLVWEKGKELNSSPPARSRGGIVPFLSGIVFFWLGELGGEYFTLYIAVWFVIVGLIWSHIDWQKVKTIAFALTLVLAMLPLPGFINNALSLSSR